MRSLFSTRGLARASAQRPKLTIALWVLGVLVSFVLVSRLLAGVLTTQADFTSEPESKRGERLLKEGFKGQGAALEPNETVIVRSQTLTVDDPAFQERVSSLYAALIALGPDVVAGGFTYLQGAPGLVSADRHTTIMPMVVRRPLENIGAVEETLAAAGAGDGFEVHSIGTGSIDQAFNDMAEKDLSAEFRVGLPAALIVLLLVFGAVVAALVPVVIAMMSIILALAVTAVIGQAFHFSFFVTNMIAMMGLAVGIDYSLLIMSRYREERWKGLNKIDAISEAGRTASRAVFVSGMTVVLALMGMLIVPTTIFRSLGAGAIIVVLIAVAAALTLLPAVISLLGDKVDALRLPFLPRRTAMDNRGGFWDKTSRAVMARPWVSLVVTGGILIAATIPTLGMKTGQAGISSFPENTDIKKSYEIVQKEFAFGLTARAEIVMSGKIEDPHVQGAITSLRTALAADEAFYAQRAMFRTNLAGDVAHLSVPMAGDPGTAGPQEAIRRLRSTLIPQAFKGAPAEALVTGGVAGNIDFFDITEEYTPIVFAFVLSLSFILLTVVFRSLVVPVKAIILNLLSVGTAYGLLVLVFQEGYGARWLGFSTAPEIEAWIPLFLFSVLFGLSMDYHVFLLSRIRERFDQTGDNDEAVAFGLRTTAGIITGAALIMVAIFSGFASGQLVMFQQVGFGLGVAVLLDATVVRSVLVPASMKLLGTRNWYLPRFLRWLPRFSAEDSETPAAEGAASTR